MQSPTTTDYAVEFLTYGEIAGVSTSRVQGISLALGNHVHDHGISPVKYVLKENILKHTHIPTKTLKAQNHSLKEDTEIRGYEECSDESTHKGPGGPNEHLISPNFGVTALCLCKSSLSSMSNVRSKNEVLFDNIAV